MDLKERIRNIIWDCQYNEFTKEVKTSIGEKLSKNSVKEIENKYRVIIHKEVKDFYEKLNGFSLCWGLKGDVFKEKTIESNLIWGNIYYYNLKQVFKGENELEPWRDILWFDFDDNKEELKQLRPFDLHNEDITACACFKVINGHVSNDVYYYDIEYGINKMELSFLEYFERNLKYRGIVNWQRKYLSEEKEEMKLIEATLKMIGFQ
ncbi:hypothetical protein ACOSP6_13990 [Tenacibaculum sp. MEBiC06402]|uniref:hypothetical protein n=1 Tax=unclassified Tenacibaculum TaxID=2635139 RepID=UPI003B9BDF42